MKGLLVRVGIDQAYGQWNAPCREDGSFCYIPMRPQREEKFDQGFKTTYADFAQDYQLFAGSESHFPKKLDEYCHLDPDFRFSTYGDIKSTRGKKIKNYFDRSTENFIAFYASFRPLGRAQEPLVYAIIGFYCFQNVSLAREVPPDRRNQNAHTRLVDYQRRDNEDIVIFADKNKSGRLKSLIEIGEYKNRQYYLQKTLSDMWGGIKSKNRWIQRGVTEFCDPDKFYQWFRAQNPDLVNENNIHY